MPSIYDFSLPSLDGKTINFSDYQGRPILLVNTASKCGFTPQYEGLQHLWSVYGREKDNGLAIIGIPSNEFGNQEPGSSDEIGAFCHRNYGVSFPMAAKASVRGPDAIPLFKWLRKEGGFLSTPRWNFYKYLINGQGHLDKWYTSLTKPEGKRIEHAVQRLLLDC
ncbi:glutathione peroxidase [Neokomagataea thailandica NBRC 106555]|uniref:Glutathione peroxidase n=2 Tax=Neokomagataea TaxID=1223423 RepID=A0A4Y6V9I3_9PROT|nr:MULTISPECIES: glutathione peroxidase [Neokomagataea]QDH25156.1 glutathione peroxidase [Neokomagataea tanensis]GBR51990.1 glutathione peroxidase [Neokomagataea thailandica NBRC 106555]